MKKCMLKNELKKCGKKVETVSDSKKPTLKQQKRLDAEITSKKVIHKWPLF